VKKITLPYWIIAALVCTLWLPWLLAKGMFMDGVYDALFAHNLAQGISTFWAPQTVYYSQPAYWDNPPLSMYLLSVWYKIFGDHYQVERIYSLASALVQIVLLMLLWRIHFSEKEEKESTWLPVLLFLISPLTGWCYSNNMMENTMSIFTTSSVVMFLLYLRSEKNLVQYSAIGGALIFLGCLTKGPVALFPLTAPFFFLWSEKNLGWKKSFTYMLVQAIVFVSVFAFVFSMDAPKNFLHHYLEVQLLPVLRHEMKTSDPHYTIFFELLLMLLPLLILAMGSVFRPRWCYHQRVEGGQNVVADNTGNSKKRTALAFILIGLSASIPIALSAKQHKYYLLPSLPMFAIGFACLILPSIRVLNEKLNIVWNKTVDSISKSACALIIVVCLFLCFKNRNGYVRDEKLLTDLEKIQPLIKSERVIRADWSLYGEWSLRGYLNRMYDKKICMPDEMVITNFYMTQSNKWGDKLPENSEKIFSGEIFDLYKLP
jgi:4-amino-4-deoxy-L-arabinose transferase-like glycosyltransferase